MRYVVGFLIGAAVGAYAAATSQALRVAIDQRAAASQQLDAEGAALAAKMAAMGVNVGHRQRLTGPTGRPSSWRAPLVSSQLC